jgi:hypothetical protein
MAGKLSAVIALFLAGT